VGKTNNNDIISGGSMLGPGAQAPNLAHPTIFFKIN